MRRDGFTTRFMGCDVHKAGFDADEGTFDHRHYGVRAEKGDGNEE